MLLIFWIQVTIQYIYISVFTKCYDWSICFHTANEPNQSPSGSAPRPTFSSGLHPVVWSAPNGLTAFTPAQTNQTKLAKTNKCESTLIQGNAHAEKTHNNI